MDQPARASRCRVPRQWGVTVGWAIAVLASGCAVRSRLPEPPAPGPTAGAGDPIDADARLAIEGLFEAVVHPLDVGVAQAHVLVFVTPDCPIANAYAPEIRRLARDYGPRGVRFIPVHVEPGIGLERVREHARSFDLPGEVAVDRAQALVAAVGATRTPEVAVVVAGPRLVYRGRIDNLFAELGVKRPTGATRRDLREALDQLLAGQPVARPWPPAVGCDVPQR